MISYGKHSIDQDDIDSVVEVLKSNNLTQGPTVSKFEDDLKKYFSARSACAVSSGTAALHLVGLSLNWSKDDIILTTPISFLATANSICYSGAKPEFIDINKQNYTIDINLLEQRVKRNTKNIKAIIAVDYAGHPCNWHELRKIADKYKITLINDNCHAMGSLYKGRKDYAVTYADLVTQSYHPVKHITTGEGGSILSNNNDLINKIRLLSSHGTIKKNNDFDDKNPPWKYEMIELGYNYRITDIQCALGCSQLKKLDNFINKRRNIARIYDEAFKDVKGFIIPNASNEVKHSYHLYPIQIDFEYFNIKKIDFFSFMKSHNINLQVHYIPIHTQTFYQKNYGYKIGDFPVSESFFEKEVSLPIFPDLTEDAVRNIILLIKNFFNVK